jgi:hypothetical protein
LQRLEGFRFSFYSGDGVEPPHVHVAKGDGAAKVWLGPVRVEYAKGLQFGGVATHPRDYGRV